MLNLLRPDTVMVVTRWRGEYAARPPTVTTECHSATGMGASKQCSTCCAPTRCWGLQGGAASTPHVHRPPPLDVTTECNHRASSSDRNGSLETVHNLLRPQYGDGVYKEAR